jgi:beta-N-acetylhexosaminidase
VRAFRLLPGLVPLMLALAACQPDTPAGGPDAAPATTPTATTTTTAPATTTACALPTLRRQLAQLLVVGFAGTEPDATATAPVKAGVGGVILFKPNVRSAAQVKRLVAGLKDASGYRLSVGVDQEPGTKVARLAGMVPVSPSARVLGRQDPAVVERAGRDLGRALKRLGITVDYAPVLDVTGGSGVIGDRSFGADAAIAGRAGTAFMRGLEAGGVMPVGKHFPGHGATGDDSHEALPTISLGPGRLDSGHVAPFRTAIKAGLPAVMVGHLRVEAVDPERPASLSPEVVDGLLRHDLGFDGLVVTDAMEMGALTDRWSIPEAAELALLAGVDQLLIGLPDPPVKAVVDHLAAAVHAGRLERSRVREAFLRVQAAKGERRWASCTERDVRMGRP